MLSHRLRAISNLPVAHRTVFRGIEKEGLRVTSERTLSQGSHPSSLGSALTHPNITTDYSEALLEFVTPVCPEPSQAQEWLQNLHRFTLQNIEDEVIWASSMPCPMNSELDVPIASYGTSNVGRMKEVYRHGLWHRYGRMMQAIAGVHYNVSFSKEMMQAIASSENEVVNREWQSAQYFHVIRNFRRHQYLLAHLFGASPAFDESFRVGRSGEVPLHGSTTRLLPGATSLRMSDIGYSNDVQGKFYVCFNALLSYVGTIDEALNTPHPPYEVLGTKGVDGWRQLNTNVLQIENEYYSDIRPKRVARSGERPSQALLDRGVEYLEVRCLDLNPFSPVGIELETMKFIDLFLLWCWVKKSPFLLRESCNVLRSNQFKTTRMGSDGSLVLQRHGGESSIRAWGLESLDRMTPLAELMEERYPGTIAALNRQKAKIIGTEETYSQQVTRILQEQKLSFTEFTYSLSAQHKLALLAKPLDSDLKTQYVATAVTSLEAQKSMEAGDTVDFDTYLRQRS